MKLLKVIAELSLGRLAILGLIVTALYFLMYYDSGASIEQQITSAESVLTQETTKKAETNRILKEESEMKANIVELARKLEVVKSKIPSDFKDNDIILLVNQTASQSGLLVETLSKGSDIKNQSATDPGFVEASKLIDEIPFNVQMSGSYNRFLDFIEKLAKSERMVRFKNLTLSKTNLARTSSNKLTIKGQIIGYRQSVAASSPGNKIQNGVKK